MSPDGSVHAPATIELTWTPTDEHFAAIFIALEGETAAKVGPCVIEPMALLLREPDGTVTGGLWGRIVYGWLVIEMLVVPAHRRGTGTGSALIARAEAVARARGCMGIHLTRLDVQAPVFYERLGFSVFGVQHDVPRGHDCFYLSKRLDAPSSISPTSRPAAS